MGFRTNIFVDKLNELGFLNIVCVELINVESLMILCMHDMHATLPS